MSQTSDPLDIIFSPAQVARTGTAYIEDRSSNKGDGVPFGVPSVDADLLPLLPGEVLVLIARPGHGKAQPLSSFIKTPNGWTTMGAIKVGDEIASPDGEHSTVSEIFPQGNMDVYEITFADGRKARCTEDHLWTVKSKHWKEPRLITTREIMDRLSLVRYKKWMHINLCNGMQQTNTGELPIPPYLMGILLGDGCLSGHGIILSCADAEILDKVSTQLLPGYKFVYAGQYDYRLGQNHRGKRNFYNSAMRDLGLLGTHSDDKFIPTVYLYSGYTDRIELLRGILDSDGTVTKDKVIDFDTTSAQLANDVQYLVWSIGGYCKRRKDKDGGYRKNGIYIPGKRVFRLVIRYRNPSDLFSLSRKSTRAIGNKYSPRLGLRIESVERVGSEPCQCILVSHPSHSYITDNFIVTHNTMHLMRWARHRAHWLQVNQINDKVVVYLTLEQAVEELHAFHVAAECGIPVDVMARGQLDEAQIELVRDYGVRRVSNPLWFIGHSIERRRQRPVISLTNVERALTRVENWDKENRRDLKIDMIMVDYLQRLPLEGNPESKIVGIDNNLNRLKDLALQFACPVCVGVQSKREVDGYQVPIPEMGDGAWCSGIEQIPDRVLACVRPIKYKQQGELFGKTLVEGRNQSLLVLWKQRLGDAPKFWWMTFDPQYNRLNEAEERDINFTPKDWSV